MDMFGGQGDGGHDPPPYPFGQPTSTATGLQSQPILNTSGIFGQPSVTSGAGLGQPDGSSAVAFRQYQHNPNGTSGQPTASSAGLFGHANSTSTAMFVQSSSGSAEAFGQPSISTSRMVGQPITATSGMFGQPITATSGMFGQPITATSGMFGQQNTTTSGMFVEQSTATSGMFGQQGTNSSGIFGQLVPSTTAQFDLPTAPASGVYVSSASSQGMFGLPSTTASATFGQLCALGGSSISTAASDQSGQTVPSLSLPFGMPAATSAVLAQLSGAAMSSPAATADRTTAAPSGGAPAADTTDLFRRAAPAAAGDGGVSYLGRSATVRSLFGAKAHQDAVTKRTVGLFGKASDGGAGQPAGLFGKTSDPTPNQPSRLFGKPPERVRDQRTGMFGKPPEQGVGLFGKPADDALDQKVGLFGNPPDDPVHQKTGPFGETSDQPAGLRGKTTGSDTGAVASRPELNALAAGDAAAVHRSSAKSVFLQLEEETSRVRQPASGGADETEASRRALSRTGLFSKPAEGRQWVRPTMAGNKTSPRLERLNSVEQLQEVTSLLCTDVPEGYNDRNILSRHFAKFGRVVRVSCNKRDNTASVHFADHASAEAAKKRGMKVHPKVPPMCLYFRRPVRQSAAPSGDQMPPDVSEELRSMSGAGDQTRSEPAPASKPRRRAAPAAAAAAATAAAAAAPAEPAATAVLNVAELRAQLRQTASSAGDRYRVLDARDKLHRAALRRESTSRSGPLVGTCPDMCPEKERYMREEKHQISAAYERDWHRQGPFEMDQRLAVKQYSRSSADQEEPLPQELRTPTALLLTMDYLVNHITDAVSRDTGDWFQFIWDRTRSIRKDITQQQLTDAVSVALVEKCARFHVHCASALCELPVAEFDQKINNENLTKCMQTLKHMYHDLSLRGIHCPREAEFRAYDILLNLNQGDTLREAQTYSDSVRRSPAVQAALRLYVALSTNNYVRFFKLVRRSDYLVSCLLQRYFTQVRTRALDIITRTFCPPKKLVEFPLSELQHSLGFENERECSSFLRQHGLESEEGTAYLDRALFQPPDAAPDVRRCPLLIDAKRTVTVGEVINGAPLPADPLPGYQPHSSFDDSHRLRSSAWDVLDQRRGAAATEPAAEVAAEGATERATERDTEGDTEGATVVAADGAAEAALVDAAVAAEAGCLLEEVVKDQVRQHAHHLLTALSVVTAVGDHVLRDISASVTDQMIREACQSTVSELKEVQRQQDSDRQRQLVRSREDQELKDRLSIVLTETLIAETCLDETNDIVDEEMDVIEQNRIGLLKDRVSLSAYDDLWIAEADRLVWETAVDVITESRRMRAARVQAAAEIGRRVTLRRLVLRWRAAAAAGRRLRAEHDRFPAALPLHGPDTALTLLGGARPPPHPPADHYADVGLCRLLLEDRLQTCPVSLAAVLSPLAVQLRCRTLWKLAVLVAPGQPLSDWLQHKLTDAAWTPDDEVLQRDSVAVAADCRLELVARAAQQPHQVAGAAALVAACAGAADAARLRPLLARLPREPLLPLAVLTTAGRRAETTAELQLHVSLRDDALATYCVFELDPHDAEQSSQALVSLLEWLFEHRAAAPQLLSGVLRHLVQDFVAEEVTCRLYRDLHLRRNKKRVEQAPSAVIALFNAAVRHLGTVMSSTSLPDVSWPPRELISTPPAGWNQPARLIRLRQTMERLALPCLELDDDCDWCGSCAQVLQYVRSLSEPGYDCTPVVYRVQCLLRERLQELEEAAWPQHEDITSRPLAASLPWTDILQCCIELRTSGLSAAETVYYLPDELTNFRVPDVWAQMTSVSHTNDSLSLDESIAIAKRPLDTSRDETVSKRRFEKSSSPNWSLDVTTGISREMDLSLDWEDRLRDIVDQGERCSGGLPPVPVPTSPQTPHRSAVLPALATSRLRVSPTRRAAPPETVASWPWPLPLSVDLDRPAEQRRRCDLTLPELRPEPSLSRRLSELRDHLSADRRTSAHWTSSLMRLSSDQS